jgi:hypothetical protein
LRAAASFPPRADGRRAGASSASRLMAGARADAGPASLRTVPFALPGAVATERAGFAELRVAGSAVRTDFGPAAGADPAFARGFAGLSAALRGFGGVRVSSVLRAMRRRPPIRLV